MKYLRKIKFIFFYALSVVPMFLLYLLSDVVFVFVYHIFRYRRKVVADNLKNAFPHKSEQEREQIEKDFYHHLCDMLFEVIKGLTISKKKIKQRFRVKNVDLIQKYYDEKRNIILYAAHQGNWEWLASLPLYLPYQINSLYLPLSSKYFEELLRIIRDRFGMICIESNKGYRAIVGFQQEDILTFNIIAGDQSPRRDSSKHWIKFLNQETAFLMGADKVAVKSNQVVIFPSFSKKRRGHYELEFKVIEEDSINKVNNEIINKYAEMLESTIIGSPELWLWSHRRWKLTRDSDG